MKRLPLMALLISCAGPGSSVSEVSSQLNRMGRIATAAETAHWRTLLEDNLNKDPYRCLPTVEQVLSPPPGPILDQRIRGQMPHYDWFHGPMLYRIGVRDGHWQVMLNVALTPSGADTIELPDCRTLVSHTHCEGRPYEADPGVKACPASGRFEAPATRDNLRALMRRWSRDIEQYWNRDARHFGLPIRYDFEFFLVDEPADRPIDVRAPLRLSCGRTPYFMAFRSGWSIPVLAHEVGHYLGLLDEYEALSGIFDFYPKTPFEGSENSRMGLSMKTHTRLMPMHHYLVLRRLHCDPPEARDPYAGVLAR